MARCCTSVVCAVTVVFVCVHAAAAYPTTVERVSGDNSNYLPLRNSLSKDLDRIIEQENLLRDLEILRDRVEYIARQNRRINSLDGVGFGPTKRFDTLSGVSFGEQKRNYDQINHSSTIDRFDKKNNDRNGYGRWARKNFDEIDRTAFNSFVKKNFDEIDRTAFNGFDKKNFDEIDRTAFNGFDKKNFDEIDRTAFNGFDKKNFDEIDRTAFNGFDKKNFDEIDRTAFDGFVKKNFDEIDRTAFDGFVKRPSKEQPATTSLE